MRQSTDAGTNVDRSLKIQVVMTSFVAVHMGQYYGVRESTSLAISPIRSSY